MQGGLGGRVLEPNFTLDKKLSVRLLNFEKVEATNSKSNIDQWAECPADGDGEWSREQGWEGEVKTTPEQVTTIFRFATESACERSCWEPVVSNKSHQQSRPGVISHEQPYLSKHPRYRRPETPVLLIVLIVLVGRRRGGAFKCVYVRGR